MISWTGVRDPSQLIEHTLSHRSGLLRIFVHDTSGILPKPFDGYTLPTDISNWPPTYLMNYDANWVEAFFKSIDEATPMTQLL